MQKHVEQQPHSRSAVVHVADDLDSSSTGATSTTGKKHDHRSRGGPPWKAQTDSLTNEEAERLPPASKKSID